MNKPTQSPTNRPAADPPSPSNLHPNHLHPTMSPTNPDHTDLWDDPRITAAALGELDQLEHSSLEPAEDFHQRIATDPVLADAVDQARDVAAQLEQHFASETVPPQYLTHPNVQPATPIQTPTGQSPRWIAMTLAATVALLGFGYYRFKANDRQVAMNHPVEIISAEDRTESSNLPNVENEVEEAEAVKEQMVQPATGVTPQSPIDEPAFAYEEELAQTPFAPATAAAPTVELGRSTGDEMMGAMAGRGGMGMGGNGMMGMNGRANGKMDFGRAPKPAAPSFDFRGRSLGMQVQGDFALAAPAGPPARLNDRYEKPVRGGFRVVSEQPLSTFSIDVDTASFTKARSLIAAGHPVPPQSVRVEEWINYLQYDYPPVSEDADHPIAVHTETIVCPWQTDDRLTRVGIASQNVAPENRKPANLVFLIDRSGSMSAENKLPLVIDGLKMLTRGLKPTDRVSIVTYAAGVEIVADGFSGDRAKKLRKRLRRLTSGGSTNGSGGILQAYDLARKHFIDDGINRVILCTDGDFNVGVTGDESLVDLVERQSRDQIELTVLGVGNGNLNDAMLEQISGRGNGTYGFLDNKTEARRWFVDRLTSTLQTVASDVKIQVEFNPAIVGSYRLIGYENRRLAARDFNDDTKDAGEIGAGHQVTALYQWKPVGKSSDETTEIDPLRYGKPVESAASSSSDAKSTEAMWVKVRYKQPGALESTKLEQYVAADPVEDDQMSDSTRQAVAMAAIAMQYAEDPAVKDQDLAEWTNLVSEEIQEN